MTGPCRYCGTNGAHYCPHDLCGPDEDLAADAECPECTNGAGNAYLGALGFSDHFRCRNCGWDWSERNFGRAQAAYEDACDMQRKARLEDP